MQEFKGTPGPWVVTNTADIFTGLGAKNSEGIEASRNDGWHVADCDMGGLCLEEVASNAQLIAAAPELLEAALFAERRSKQPGEGQTEYFERIADEFYRKHGYLAPGKDDPMRSVSREEAMKAWDQFLAEPAEARKAAIAKALNTDTTER
ncbi:hypothetical protein [Alcanivorax sediminis]|uniref:hypothetical protein n=1 Tax=Alcanivorax sediminis TaxID=2663008 RepID=UPI003C6F2872